MTHLALYLPGGYMPGEDLVENKRMRSSSASRG